MTGFVQEKKGKLYIVLSYKDEEKWKVKWISTGLKAKGNIRKAERTIPDVIEKYSYLEVRTTEVSPDISVKAFMDHWLVSMKSRVRGSTYEGYAYRVEKIKSYFDMEMRRLTPQDIENFIQWCLVSGKTDPKTGERKPLAVRTVREYKNVLSAACDQAVMMELLRRNPCRSTGIRVSGKSNRQYTEEMLFLSKEEISDLIHFLDGKESYKMLVPITFIGAYYGLRRSEILGLKWDAIDFERHTIKIKRTVVRIETVHEEEKTKTNASLRELALFPGAEIMLRKIKEQQDTAKDFYGRDYVDSGYVFAWDDGRPYDPNYITRMFKLAVRSFGRPELSLHKLRHSCASLLIELDWDIKKIQYWLGHEDVQTTLNIYAHYNKHKLVHSVDDLADISKVCNDLW